jgi:hypothetical protein
LIAATWILIVAAVLIPAIGAKAAELVIFRDRKIAHRRTSYAGAVLWGFARY